MCIYFYIAVRWSLSSGFGKKLIKKLKFPIKDQMADDRRGWWKSMINRENNQAEQKIKLTHQSEIRIFGNKQI